MKLVKSLLIFCLVAFALPLNAKDYPASMFGIESNGTTMNTRSIQKAIDFIHENGGGRLVFKVGRYVTGTLYLKSNVTIELSEGAILVGSTNPYDYDLNSGWLALIFALGQENIGIEGKGVIDGRGRQLANNFVAQACNGVIKDNLKLGRVENRPKLIYFQSCKNVNMKGITVKNPAFWTQTYDKCENLLIDGITVSSRATWNNDGMDIVDCNDAVIQNCFVDATDDGICLKSHDHNSICQNIVVKNNTVTSSASGIKFGTFSKGGFKNIKIVNNTVYDTFRSAITIQAVDGGWVENVEIDSLRSINTGNPIYLVLGDRYTNGKKSHMEKVKISNMYAEVPAGKPDLGYAIEGPTHEYQPRNISPNGIVGLADNKILDVTIENCEFVFPGGGNENYAKVGLNELDIVPELPKAYPEFSQFKELPAWCFYVRHVDGLTFKNIKMTAKEKDYRPAIVLDDVHNGTFKQVSAKAPAKKQTIYVRNNCSKIKK
jgi:hypothetical protein